MRDLWWIEHDFWTLMSDELDDLERRLLKDDIRGKDYNCLREQFWAMSQKLTD